MNVKGYTNKICAGIIGFDKETRLKDIISISKKLSELKEFKKIIIRRASKDRWGIDFLLKNKKEINQIELEKIINDIKKKSKGYKINEIDVSGDIIQIKPKSVK